MVIKRLWLEKDPSAYNQWAELLNRFDLIPDEQVDWTIGIFEEERLIATGSLYQNIVKCIAIDPEVQGENLLTKLMDRLKDTLQERGYQHIFLYTKPEMSRLFKSIGFSEIIQTKEVIFMEQGFPDFEGYLDLLRKAKRPTKKNAGIVMNANPFTNGHLYLVTEAAKMNETVYVFVVSEERSLFSTETRMKLVKAGLEHLKNVVVLPTREYIVSSATFPAYFLKDQARAAVAKVQATLDATLFKDRIAAELGISTRFVGEEPFSEVTEIYNQTMQQVFQKNLSLVIIPRKAVADKIISATYVRGLIEQGAYEAIKPFVPTTTYQELLKMKNKQ